MSSGQGIQITIPDFDDLDLPSAPIPFGRTPSSNVFGQATAGSVFGQAATGSVFGHAGAQNSPTLLGLDSPSGSNSTHDRLFQHTRADSTASIDSTGSTTTRGWPARQQPAISKKPSFASIRNAFKSNKSAAAATSEPPPLPHIDAYPVLKNPFNRSNTSLPAGPSTIRPSTSASASTPRSKAPSRAGHHAHAKSQHSLASDGGSDHGHGYQAFSFGVGAPPVPRVPGAFRSDPDSDDGLPEDAITPNPTTPAEYALHALFIRFAALAEARISLFLAIDPAPLLTAPAPDTPWVGLAPGCDPAFDEVLKGLAIVASKGKGKGPKGTSARTVIDSVMRWRRSTLTEGSSSGTPSSPNVAVAQYAQSHSRAPSRSHSRSNTSLGLGPSPAERKSLVSIYITTRALVCILDVLSSTQSSSSFSASKDPLGDAFGYTLEETFFDQFRRPESLSSLSVSLLSSSKSLSASGKGTTGLASSKSVSHKQFQMSDSAGRQGGQTLKQSPRQGGSSTATGGSGGGGSSGGYGQSERNREGAHAIMLHNYRVNTEMYALLLGLLSRIRFPTITDRFLHELDPLIKGTLTKDSADGKYENLLRGMRFIGIKVYPPEAFEEASEFMQVLTRAYANAHGARLKVAFCEILEGMLHPIGKTATAETNIPAWGTAITTLFPRSREMCAKPRYWGAAFPLMVTALCVGPTAHFARWWTTVVEGALVRMKDGKDLKSFKDFSSVMGKDGFSSVMGKDTSFSSSGGLNSAGLVGGRERERPARVVVLNGLLRIVWTYLYRSQETPSTTMQKLDQSILKHFFPPNRLGVSYASLASPSILVNSSTIGTSNSNAGGGVGTSFTASSLGGISNSGFSGMSWSGASGGDMDTLDFLSYIIHFILSRHFEYGKELCLELMQEIPIASASASTSPKDSAIAVANCLAPERLYVAVNAILLTLAQLEKEVTAPSWPSSSDFGCVPTTNRGWASPLIGSTKTGNGGKSGSKSNDASTPDVDYPSSSSYLPTVLGNRPGIKDLLVKGGACLSTFVMHASAAVLHMSVFDDAYAPRYSYGQGHGYSGYDSPDTSQSHITRRHPDGTVVSYPAQIIYPASAGAFSSLSAAASAPMGPSATQPTLSYVSVLQTAFASWPRFLPSSMLIVDAVDLLLRGVVHVEPMLGEAAVGGIRRLMDDGSRGRGNALTVVARFTSFVFTGGAASGSGAPNTGVRMYSESALLVPLWVEIVEAWLTALKTPPEKSTSTTTGGTLGPGLGLGLAAEAGGGMTALEGGRAFEDDVERETILSKCDDIEAAALFLLSRETALTHSAGVKAIRLLGRFLVWLHAQDAPQGAGTDAAPTSPFVVAPDPGPLKPIGGHLHFTALLHANGSVAGTGTTSDTCAPYLTGFDNLLDRPHLARLEQWKALRKDGLLLRIVDSSAGASPQSGSGGGGGGSSSGGGNAKDPGLWRYIYPAFFKSCGMAASSPGINDGGLVLGATTLAAFREMVVVAVQRYHPVISYIAGLSSRVPPGLSRDGSMGGSGGERMHPQTRLLRDHKPLIDQWHMWVKILCSTAILPESSSRPQFTTLNAGSAATSNALSPPQQHARAPSDMPSFERERLSTSRGLFRHLTPFLDSEHTTFRDAATQCISAFPPNTYPQLLEDLNLTVRQFYGDSAGGMGMGSGSKAGGPSMLATAASGSAAGGAGMGMGDDPRARGYAHLYQERTRRQERLHSAVARIYCLTAHNLNHLPLEPVTSSAYASHPNASTVSLGTTASPTSRQAALAHVLKFVRNTQVFLTSPDARDTPSLQRLRRYFCGTIERLCDALTAAGMDADSAWEERNIRPQMYLTLYRLCEEWCQLGPQSEGAKRRLEGMYRLVQLNDENGGQEDVRDDVERFKDETGMLSYAAVGALTALCQKAFFPGDGTALSPTDKHTPELIKPLTALQVVERFDAILGASHKSTQTKGKKGLKSLLTSIHSDSELRVEVLRRAAIVSNKREGNTERIFEVVAETVCEGYHHFSFEQVVCLGLTNLRHPSVKIRSLAFDMLEAVHQQHGGLLAMSTFAPAIASLAPGTYIHAHRLVVDFLAGEHPHQASPMLVQLSSWLPSLHPAAFETNIILLLLQSFEFWVSNITLTSEPGEECKLSRDTVQMLFHLMKLSLHYQDTHSEQVLILWMKLVEPPNHANGDAAIQFLVEQSQKVGNTIYIECAANIVACLCQTPIGERVFEELCSIIVPVRMLPIIDHKLSFPDPTTMTLWEDLDALFAGHPRLTMGAAQSAWLFLSDVSLQRYWEMTAQLPILLHATFTHLDHRESFIRYRARSMLFQILRSWVPGYDELLERSQHRSQSVLKERVMSLQRDIERHYWAEDESSADVEPKMTWICQRILEILEPLSPNLASSWGTIALEWGTACSVRAVAFRSLQLFRALMPWVKKTDLAHLLGRLSNTISSPDVNIQHFTSEIFATLRAVIDAQGTDKTLLPQIFWCICACLSTTVEGEFSQCLDLLNALIQKVDLDDHEVTELLLSQVPPDWEGPTCIQPNLLKGLRSSVTSPKTIAVIQTLGQFQDSRLIDPTEGRLRDMYTAMLPWCLHAMDNQDKSASAAAEQIAFLAGQEGKHSIQRIMTSFAKSHFRTRDDFLRQSVSSLREHYGAKYWTEITTLLMSLVLNSQRWLRIHSMEVLKVLFQHRETRNPVELLGSELLMPLLCLLETDLAPQALDVLEEPISMFGGPAAKHVLRMSMHLSNFPSAKSNSDPDSVTVVFGTPSDSGWSIAQEDSLRELCQGNVLAVFDTCSIPTRPSRIDFEPEVEALAFIQTPIANRTYTTLSPTNTRTPAKNFQELDSFFRNPDIEAVAHSTPSQVPIPTRRLEARVAAILAKSTAPETAIPPTPFIDVFRIESGAEEGFSRHNAIQEQDSDLEEGEEDYDSESDADSFIFDNVASARTAAASARNGGRGFFH